MEMDQGKQAKRKKKDVQQFLLQAGRLIRNIAMDGNCFFQTVSYHLLGKECEHSVVRTHLLRFLKMIIQSLSPPPPPLHKASFDDHIKHLLQPTKWCTHLPLTTRFLCTAVLVVLTACSASIGRLPIQLQSLTPSDILKHLKLTLCLVFNFQVSLRLYTGSVVYTLILYFFKIVIYHVPHFLTFHLFIFIKCD